MFLQRNATLKDKPTMNAEDFVAVFGNAITQARRDHQNQEADDQYKLMSMT